MSAFGIDKQYDAEEKEYQDYWNKKGENLGYDSEPCKNCGRVRVEKYANGELICEKCHWNKTLQKYEDFGY